MKSKAVVFLFVCLVFLLLVGYIFKKASFPFSGDEPHYLLTTFSLIRDGDFDVKNNYLSEDHKLFYSKKLDWHINSTFNQASPSWYSIHGPGLPILLAPSAFVFGIQKGPVLFMVLIDLALFVLVFYWVYKIVRNEIAALLTAFIFFFSIFNLGLIGHIFPDLVISLFLLASLMLVKKTNSYLSLFILGLLLGFLPWVHVKTVLVSITIAFIVLISILTAKSTLREKAKKSFLFVIPGVFLFTLLTIKSQQWYGSWLLTSIYSGNEQLFKLSPLYTIPAMFFDRAKGLFVNNPIFLLAVIGMPIWIKKFPSQVFKLVMMVLPTFLVLATFNDWWGGWSPSGRYLMEFVPIFLPAVGFVIMKRKIFLKYLVIFLVFLQLSFSSVYLFNLRWTDPGDKNKVFSRIEEKTSLSLNEIVPSFGPNKLSEEKDRYLVVFYTCVLIPLLYFGNSMVENKKGRFNSMRYNS